VSLHFLSAKPRNGKSRGAIDILFDELVYGNRHIITNLPLHLDRINELFQTRFPRAYERRYVLRKAWESYVMGDAAVEVQVDCPLRHITDDIKLIPDADLGRFFTYRGNDVRLDHITNEQWKSGKRPDYSRVNDLGVLYILDEVHIAFNARAWASTGAEVLFYLSQHAKLSDTVIAITQNVGNVDKQFRSLAQDFTYYTYLKKRRFGRFRLPDRFVWRTYPEVPTSDRAQPMDTGFFGLDEAGYASCYDTAKGVGIHGRAGADTNERKKGFHWSWLVGGFLLAAFLAFKVMPGFLARHFVPQPQLTAAPVGKRPEPVQTSKPVSPPVKVGSLTMYNSPLRSQPAALQQSQGDVENVAVMPASTAGVPDTDYSVTCNGWLTHPNGSITVFLSDGTTADSSLGEVSLVTAKFATVNGVRYPVRKLRNSDIAYNPSSETRFPNLPATIKQTRPATRPVELGQENRD
jgi:hypothetical protein